MDLIKCWDKKIKSLDWKDILLIKISSASFILMIAKLWEPLLSLEWYSYGIVFLLTATLPFYNTYIKK